MEVFTGRRISNFETPNPGKLEREWAKMNLSLTELIDLQEAALIVLNVTAEFVASGSLLTSDTLAPFVCEEIFVRHGAQKAQSTDELAVPKVPIETIEDNEQEPSGSGQNKEREDENQEDRKTEEPMEQDHNQTKKTTIRHL